MRAIDADALLDNLYITIGDTTTGRRNYVMTWEIEEAPTLDVSERESEVDYCNNCPYISWGEDCISREWLINHFKDMVEHYEMRIKRAKRHGEKTTYDTSKQISYWKDEIADYKYFIREIENAPSVTPTERIGEWVEDGYYDYPYYVCSNCGQECGVQNNGVEIEPLRTKYCPNCGAKMRGEK